MKKRGFLCREGDSRPLGRRVSLLTSQTSFETQFCHSLAVRREKLLNLTELWFPGRQRGAPQKDLFVRVLWGLNRIMHGPELGLRSKMWPP